MTTPVLLDTPPSFAELQQQVKEGVRTGALLLDLTMLAPQLAPKLENLLSLAKIQLGALKAEVGDTEIRARGTWKLAATAFAVEARFADAGSGLDCTLAIAPTRNPLDAVGGDLARILKALPIKPADFWVTLSTVEQRAARIAIEGHEVADAFIAQGRGYLMRFEGRLLELADLEQTVFSLADRLEQPVFRVNLNKKISIKPLLELQLDGLTFADAQQLTLSGAATLRLFGATLNCTGDLALSTRSIGFSADVDPIVKLLNHVFFHAFTLQKSRASITGTLDAYVVGLSGQFKITGSPDGGGKYQAQYSSGNTTPFPDLFELIAGKITPSDALTVITGIPIRLPNALDRLIVLEGVYLYYAAFDGRPTLSGVPSRRGAALHGDIVLLGYRGYVAAEAFEDSYRLALFLNPIDLGIIEIGGSGEATPAAYKGTKVKPGAIRLELDSKKKQGAGDIRIRFLQQAVVTQHATLGEQGLEFAYIVSLPQPLGDREYACTLGHERLRMTTRLDIEVGISDFGVHIPRLASVQGSIAIDAGTSGASATVSATIRLGPLALPLSLKMDAADLAKLPQAIVHAVEDEVAGALRDAVKWLQVALEGLLKSGTREIERGLMKIGDELNHRFNLAAKDAAHALKAAGYAMEQALWVLSKNPLEDLMSTFGAAGAYTLDEIVGGLSKLCNQAKPEYLAREIGGLLSTGGLVGEPLARVVMGLSKDIKKAAEALGQIGRSAEEAARFLIGAKTPVAEAATILGGAFLHIEKQTLRDSMKAAGYAEREITKFLDKLWDEGGKLVTNLRKEVQRAWDRYVPSIKL